MIVALDIETTGLNLRKDRIHGVGIVSENNKVYYLPSQFNRVEGILSDSNIHIVGHNIRFDLKFLRRAGFKINCTVWDTKLLAQLIDENQMLGLKPLSEKYLGDGSLAEKSELDRAISKLGLAHVGQLCAHDMEHGGYGELIGRYCLEDCSNTLALFALLTKKIRRIDRAMRKLGYEKTPLSYYTEEALPTENVLMAIEERGILLDVEGLQSYKKDLTIESDHFHNTMNELALPKIEVIEERLYQRARTKRSSKKGKDNVERSSEKCKTKFNWQSSDHLASLVYDEYQILPQTFTPKGKPSTSEATLHALHRQFSEDSKIKDILGVYAKWKKNQKLLSTYIGDLAGKTGILSHVEDGRVYPEYLQAGFGRESSKGGTVTGRLSVKNPPIQTLPRGSHIKKYFKPDPGKVFVYFDYSQLELRIAAHLSKDTELCRAYELGIDLHQQTADALGIERQAGKTINFALIYWASAFRIFKELDEKYTIQECERFRTQFFDKYSEYLDYLHHLNEMMEKHGCVVTEVGRVRRLPELNFADPKRNKKHAHALKQGYNFPDQGLGASITKRAIIALHRKGYQLVTQVHDSVILQCSQVDERMLADIKATAEGIYPLRVPLKVDMKVLTSFSETDTIAIGG